MHVVETQSLMPATPPIPRCRENHHERSFPISRSVKYRNTSRISTVTRVKMMEE